MRRLIIGIVVLLPLISFAHAGIFDGLFGTSNTISTSTTTISNSNTVAATSLNTTIATNSLQGSLSLTSSSGSQYNYQVLLPKNLLNGSSIFTFYLLGYYNNSLGYQYPAKVSCATTYQINCTAIFLVTLGKFDRLEVIRNGVWLYALKLPKNITTSQVQAVITVGQKTNNNDTYILYVFGIIAAVLIIGNVSYDKYRLKKNPNAYNEVNP